MSTETPLRRVRALSLLGIATVMIALPGGHALATSCRVLCRPAIERCVQSGNRRSRCRRQLRRACLLGQGACNEAFVPSTTSTTTVGPTTSTTATVPTTSTTAVPATSTTTTVAAVSTTTSTTSTTTTTTLLDLTGDWFLLATLTAGTCPDEMGIPPTLNTLLTFTQTGSTIGAFIPEPGFGLQGALTNPTQFYLTGILPIEGCTVTPVLVGTVVSSSSIEPATVVETFACDGESSDQACFVVWNGKLTR